MTKFHDLSLRNLITTSFAAHLARSYPLISPIFDHSRRQPRSEWRITECVGHQLSCFLFSTSNRTIWVLSIKSTIFDSQPFERGCLLGKPPLSIGIEGVSIESQSLSIALNRFLNR